MPDQGKNLDLAMYRLEQAERCLKSAKILFEANDYKSSAKPVLLLYFSLYESRLGNNHV